MYVGMCVLSLSLTHTHTENEGIGQEGNMRQLDRRRKGKPRHRGFVKPNPRTYGLP